MFELVYFFLPRPEILYQHLRIWSPILSVLNPLFLI
nr:MAG TPA: hypothetical protein [Caudoviricetes sp.]